MHFPLFGTVASSRSSLPPISLNLNFNGQVNVTGWIRTGSLLSLTNTPFNNPPNSRDYGSVGTDGIGIRALNPDGISNYWAGTSTAGATTGDDSGIFPDNVLSSAWFTDGTRVGQLELYNHTGTPLDGRTFNIEIVGSRGSITGPRTSQYRVNGGSWQTLNVANNTANSVIFNNVQSVSGVILIEIQNTEPSDSQFGYLNGLKISST